MTSCHTAVADPLGNAKGNVRRIAHDALGRPIRVDEPDGNVRVLERDGEGNVILARDRLRELRFTYQGLGKPTSRTIAGTTVRFEYDTEERLVAFVNEKGHAYRFERDPVGDVLAEVWLGIARTASRSSPLRSTDAGHRVRAAA
jgi:YD repeat-containing protein